MPLKKLTVTGLLAALVCVAAPIAIPIGQVPVSLAMLSLYIAGSVGGMLSGTVAVGVYILIGAIGLPVFAGYAGGVGILLGPTGGYIIGYIPCVLIVGLMARNPEAKFWRYPVGMALGTVLCYAVGTVWFILYSGCTVRDAMLLCVIPFLPWDAVKIGAACAICPRLRKAISKIKPDREKRRA